MELLTQRNGGQKVTTTQILYAIYGEQLRAAQERAAENENPFEEDYLKEISSKPDPTAPEAAIENVSEDDLGDLAPEEPETTPTVPPNAEPAKPVKKK